MAANPERGEVDLVAGERTYTLAITTHALCAMEKRSGKTFGQILTGLMAINVTDTRDYLRAVLDPLHGKDLKRQAEKERIEYDEVVSKIIDAATLRNTKTALVELFRLNTPDDEETPKKDEGTANPPGAEAEAGTGGNSMSTVAPSA